MSGRTFRYRNTFKPRPVKVEEEEEEEEDEEEEESVYYALCEDDRVGLARMLREGLNPNFTFNGSNQLGKTALHLCCEKGLMDCARLFMMMGAKLNARDAWHQTPLMYAICTERLEMVKLMVAAGVSLNKRDRYGKGALHFTVEHETTECMKVLLAGGADINVPDALGRTPLWMAAAEDGHVEVMACLLENGADVYCRDIREKRTPLQAALAHTDKDTVNYLHQLLKANAPVNTVDEFGHTCIMNLIKRAFMEERDFTEADKEKIKILLDAGHDIDLICKTKIPGLWYQYHDTALNLAITKNLPVAAQFLLEVGADPDKYGCVATSSPPLLTAARENRLDIARMLLRANCDMSTSVPDPANETSVMTPFRCAVEHEHWEFVELMLQAGYNLQPELYLVTNENVPDQLVLNLDLWSRLIEHLAIPLPLLFQSRQRIRNLLGRKLYLTVDSLPLPTFLKDFLLMKNL